MNVVILTGRLTAEPELRYTQQNVPCTSFNLAVDRAKFQPIGLYLCYLVIFAVGSGICPCSDFSPYDNAAALVKILDTIMQFPRRNCGYHE